MLLISEMSTVLVGDVSMLQLLVVLFLASLHTVKSTTVTVTSKDRNDACKVGAYIC